MSKEIRDIIAAFHKAQAAGRQTALATVVQVEGSSYRRPGARMLVEDNGCMTGAISGGCLEGDALRKALLAINQQQNKLITYDTMNEDSSDLGVQLGCNGIVHILFEPVDVSNKANPICLLEQAVQHRRHAVLATLFNLEGKRSSQPGTCFFFDGEQVQALLEDEAMTTAVTQDAAAVLNNDQSMFARYAEGVNGFIELLKPNLSIIVVGAGNDAMPLLQMAGILGWQTTLVDGRPSHANRQRFPDVGQLAVGKPAEVLPQLNFDERTAVVLMTHNYNYDMAMLELLSKQQIAYVGLLGPKKKLMRMFDDIHANGISLADEFKETLYGPTGLDIGAETSDEIALSVLSEIIAVINQEKGGMLKEKPTEIHVRKLSIG